MTLREYEYKVATRETNEVHAELAKEYIDYIISRTTEDELVYIWLAKLADGLYLTETDVKEVVKEYEMQVIASFYHGTCILVA